MYNIDIHFQDSKVMYKYKSNEKVLWSMAILLMRQEYPLVPNCGDTAHTPILSSQRSCKQYFNRNLMLDTATRCSDVNDLI